MRIPIILILIFFDNLVFAENKPFSNPKYIEEYFCKVEGAYKMTMAYDYEQNKKYYDMDKSLEKPSKYYLDKFDLNHSAYSPFKLSIESREILRKVQQKLNMRKLPVTY